VKPGTPMADNDVKVHPPWLAENWQNATPRPMYRKQTKKAVHILGLAKATKKYSTCEILQKDSISTRQLWFEEQQQNGTKCTSKTQHCFHYTFQH
jgi:hypothetical protein